MGETLFIAHRIPFPPNRGDKIRSHHILRRLAGLAPIHIATFADDERDIAEEVELAALVQSYRKGHTGRLRIAGTPIFMDGVVSTLIADFQMRHPLVELRLFTHNNRIDLAAEVERRGDEVELAVRHRSSTPAARSIRQVRIKGRPMSAVGSSLSMDSSKAMPKPSLLALPAQS